MSTVRETATAEHADFAFLDKADPSAAEALCHRLGYLQDGESITKLDIAGEGNMNLVLRVTTNRRSVILKQSRPWVEKYDMIAAPWDRAVVEKRFYERVRGNGGVADVMPALLGDDAETRTLLLEDLGEASDLSSVYSGGKITVQELQAAATYLRKLHELTLGEQGDDFANREMRQLNHAHIYDIPMQDHGMIELNGLEPGLAQAAKELRADEAFVAAVKATGQAYLAKPTCDSVLLHGDFFPGSLVRTKQGLRVIDPEFCFAGDRAIDVGIMTGHLLLAGRPTVDVRAFHEAYGVADVDASLLARVAGCEVVRRLIGVAQLPIVESKGRRAALLLSARKAVVGGSLEPFLQ